jgi:glutamyl-Q tRNA(Asp) synthetase
MSYVGRFAPSPTGPLHFGSLIAALASFLDAKAHGGKWLVRIEDIDETRCDAECIPEILRTLQAFGLQWDDDVQVQTARKALYGAAFQRLASRGLVYACACSRKEIADTATKGLKGSVYVGTCRDKCLTENGNSMRVRTSSEKIFFSDLVQGEIVQCIEEEIGDFVLKRRDGLFAYQLAVVADDAEQGITHVVRGADLLDSTARQIYLQRLLGLATAQYLHIPVAVNALGQKLSKQTLATAVSTTNDAVRCALLSALSFLGQSTADAEGAVTIEDVLTIATRNWDRSRIPRTRTRLVSTEP